MNSPSRLASRLRRSFKREVARVFRAEVAWSVLFVFVVLLLLSADRWGGDYEDLAVGQPAHADVRARTAFEHPDDARTQQLRAQARETVLDVFVHDLDHAGRLSRNLSEVFEDGRAALALAAQEGEGAVARIGREMQERIPQQAQIVLLEQGFDAAIERDLTSALEKVMVEKVVGNKPLLERGPALMLLTMPDDHAEEVRDFGAFLDLAEARRAVRSEVLRRLALPSRAEEALAELTMSFVDANVHADHQATRRARQDAELAVRQRYSRVAQGDLLVRKGERVTAEQLTRLQYASDSRAELGFAEWLSFLVLAVLLAFFLYRYTRHQQRAFRKREDLHALLVLMVLSMLVLSKSILWLAWKIVDNLDSPFNQLASYAYAIPLGAGAILVALLANGRIATVYSAFVALLFGVANGWDSYLIVWAMLVQCAGVYAISTYRERAALLRAGLVVGSAGAVAALALETLRGTTATLPERLFAAGLGFLGGAVGVGLLVSFSLPVLESLFNVLTDIRLLELSNVNNPLLSLLALKAPGSYNHSLIVGTLAAEGAKAIGANSLFCRVAAFYHDIGKINKPEYFVENQRGANPHDRLSPSMSALIISSHVKDGIRLAREAGLPEQIVDIIPQHHGTKLMTYFYEKAKSQADPSLSKVEEGDFRYPGPKPQTREAAIFMLADAVEAAARTIDEPTANRLREMIRKVTNAVVVQGELDSCDVTFADLDKIQDAFLRCLVSMYHHRVDYPGFDFSLEGESKAEVRPVSGPGTLGERKVVRSS